MIHQSLWVDLEFNFYEKIIVGQPDIIYLKRINKVIHQQIGL